MSFDQIFYKLIRFNSIQTTIDLTAIAIKSNKAN